MFRIKNEASRVITLANIKSLKDVKIRNTEKVLACILEKQSISRVEIAELCGLAPSTVGQVVSSLIDADLVVEYQSGISTGGRKPILLRVNPQYGVTILFEVKRSGLSAKTLDLNHNILEEKRLLSRMPTGNVLLDYTETYVTQIQNGKGTVPKRVLGVGMLCQDDIPEYDLTVEFSTGVMSDVIRIERALASRCNVPVKKELINRYTLNCYLRNSDIKCENYVFLNLGERITASFVLNNMLVQNSNDAVFDISSAVLAGNYAAMGTSRSHTLELAQELALKKLSAQEMAEKLTLVLNSALLFFPVDNVFVGGPFDNLDQVVSVLSQNFYLKLAVWKANFGKMQIASSFARQILLENYKQLLTAR